MRIWFLTALLVTVVAASGCASFGANKVVSSHMSYNDAVQLTITREVLANIVRSRYADPIQFLAVAAINAQFSVSAGASAGVGGIGAGAAGDVGGSIAGVAGELGGSIGYSDSPTITYMSQTDAGFRMGLFFIEEDGGARVRLARYRLVLALTVPDPDDPRAIEALADLGVAPGRSQYILRPPLHATPGDSDPYAIWVVPRSMSDVLNLASRFVVVPAEHAGIVPTVAALAADSWDVPPIQIRSSKNEPPYPYRIKHRGHWFYVDDTEIESKVFLDAMVVAYSSRVGSFQAGDAAPQVVIPVGGGRP